MVTGVGDDKVCVTNRKFKYSMCVYVCVSFDKSFRFIGWFGLSVYRVYNFDSLSLKFYSR